MHIRITDTRADIVTFPLVEPFAVATRTAYEARNVVVQITATLDRHLLLIEGLGAAAPVSYVTGETHEGALATLRDALARLAGDNKIEAMRLGPMLARAKELIPDQPSARAALEMALYDLWGQARGMPLWHHFGAARERLTADLTIPIVGAEDAGEKARRAWEHGFRHLKIKVGDPTGGIDADYDRLAAVAEAAPQVTLRVDANQAFTPTAAVEFARCALQIAPRIELIEQPVAKEDIDGLAYVHDEMRRFALPALLFADESAQTVASVVDLLKREAVDGINIKLMKSGLADALEIATVCHAQEIKLMVGCMLESQLSLTAACALVAGCGLFDYIDLDSHHLLSPSDFFHGGMRCEGPTLLPETEAPGWGVHISRPDWNNGADKIV